MHLPAKRSSRSIDFVTTGPADPNTGGTSCCLPMRDVDDGGAASPSHSGSKTKPVAKYLCQVDLHHIPNRIIYLFLTRIINFFTFTMQNLRRGNTDNPMVCIWLAKSASWPRYARIHLAAYFGQKHVLSAWRCCNPNTSRNTHTHVWHGALLGRGLDIDVVQMKNFD